MTKRYTSRSILYSPNLSSINHPRRLLFGVVFLLGWLALIVPVQAQNATGSITGTVTDPSGAVIANAVVNVTNRATGAARRLIFASTRLHWRTRAIWSLISIIAVGGKAKDALCWFPSPKKKKVAAGFCG